MKISGGADIKDGHLISFLKNSGLHDPEFAMKITDFAAISSPSQHKPAVEDALGKMVEEGGSTGAQLAYFARAAADLDIVCWPGVPGEFLAPEEAHKLHKQLDRPTIMWNAYGTFAFFATSQPSSGIRQRVDALKSQAGGMKTGDISSKPKSATYKANLMPAWVVLAHEIGHYRQYVQKRQWFLQCLDTQDIDAIERDNLASHEDPILRTIGLSPRSQYQDFKGGTNDTAEKHIQWDTLPHGDAHLCSPIAPDLKLAKEAFDVKLVQQKARKQAYDTKLQDKPKVQAMGKTKCPRCGKMVNNKNVDKECNSFLHA